MVFCFVQKFFFGQHTRVRIKKIGRAKREFFFQNLTLGYMTKTLNQDYYFFPPPKSEYFFQQHWESEYFFRKKKCFPLLEMVNPKYLYKEADLIIVPLK